MSAYLPEPPHRHDQPPRTGVLLLNLGTPDAPTPPALRRYLKQFLSDPRVVELPRALWWLILNGIILNTRPKKSAAKYAAVWTPEGSPLRVHTEKQTKLLKGWLGEQGQEGLEVAYAMRYGQPAVGDVLAQLKAKGCDRLLILPLYPQFSASTTGSALDGVFQPLLRTRNLPELRYIRNFHDHPAYIGALAAQVRDFWSQEGRPGPSYRLLISFHGLPRRSLDQGDPYYCECQKTARLLRESLELAPEQVEVCFQSRFGKMPWLQPYTAPTLEKLAQAKVERVDVICPGFVSDCLETLEEIGMEGKATFLAAGGKTFHYIPCLNERPDWIAALGALVLEHLQGWSSRPAPNQDTLAATALRAKLQGAPH